MRIDVLLASCVLALGMGCFGRDTIAPPVYEPQVGESDSFPLVVRVTDAKTTEPLAGVAVEIWGSSVRATTDMVGQCQLLWLRPGRYTLLIEYLGYVPLRRRIRFNPEHEWSNLDIRLEPRKIDFGRTVEAGGD